MLKRAAVLVVALAIGSACCVAQDSTIYVSVDPLETDVYIFHQDHSFTHYSRSLGQFYCGSGGWSDEQKVRTVTFGTRDTASAMNVAAWNLIATGGGVPAPLHYVVSPSQHSFKIKKERLMYYDHRYSLWQRLRGEKAGYLDRQP